MIAQTWVVMWSYNSGQFLIDFDDEETAHRFAATIAEAGRKNILVTKNAHEIDDAELTRARERIMSKINSLVLKEAAG